MARQANPFSLLEDDDGGGDDDLAVLLARAAAKAPQKPAAPPAEYARGRGGRGRGGFRSDGDGGRFGGRGESGGRGRRGRGFYENQAGGGNWNEGGEGFEEGGEVRREGNGEEVGDSWKETRGFGGGNRGFRIRHGGRGYGGDNRGFRGGDRPRYGGKYGMQNEWSEGLNDFENHGGEGHGYDGNEVIQNEGNGGCNSLENEAGDCPLDGGNDWTLNEKSEGWNATEDKENAADGKEQGWNIVTESQGSTGWDIPETTDAGTTAVPKDTTPEQANPTASEDVSEKKPPEEKEEDEMTLNEYEKLLQEKRKALEALKTEERKVIIDEEFEGMHLVEKKKEDDITSKLGKLKKKDSLEKEEKVRKSLSMNEFLKHSAGERYAGPTYARGRGGRGRGERGGFAGRQDRIVAAPNIEDPGQFPLL